MAADARLKTIQELAAEMNKTLGEDTMIIGSQARQDIPRLSTGVLAYDLALGGGWAKNQWNEIVATPTFGKNAVAYKTIAHNQAINPDFIAMLVAAETYVRSYAEAIGVDTDRLWVVESNELEPCCSLVLKAMENRVVDMVVLDSIPAFVSIGEIDKDMDEVTVANTPRILSTFFKKARRAQRRSLVKDGDRDCTMIALNSWRDAIGVKYGDPRTTPGGKAKDQEYFIRVELTRDEWIAQGSTLEDRVGQVIKMRSFKNKVGPQQRTGQVDFYFDDTKNGAFHFGEFDTLKDIINVSIALGVIRRKGAWYYFGEYKWNGKKDIPGDVRADLDLQTNLRAECFRVYEHRGEALEDESDAGTESE